MSLLYLTQQGTQLRKDHGRFVVRQPDQAKVEVLIKEVEHICLFGNVHLSTSAIATCLHHQIPVVFLSQTGSYKGHLWSAEHQHQRIETAQHQRFTDPMFQMETAKAIVAGKIENSRQHLLKLNRRRDLTTVSQAAAGLKRDLSAVQQLTHEADRLERLRGYEGTAATRYFLGLGQLIKHPEFTFTKRTRRPPTDPVNSLLSFGYTLLFNNVLSLLRVEGLNPYLGNLHRSDRPEAQLAFDLMEEFRSPIVDTLVLQLINQNVFSSEDFTLPNAAGGVYLIDSSRKRFLQAFEKRIMSEIQHPDSNQAVPYRQAIVLQLRRYKQCLQTGTTYAPFRRTT
ncbi:MAG: CRISPR-associated endonuclease Cas1 [Cyanobacteria bacterium P01_H01_bin.152]